MRKLLYSLLTVAVIFLGGCTKQVVPAPSDDPVTPEPTPELAAEYLESTAFDPYWEAHVAANPERVVLVGWQSCSQLDRGWTVYEVSNELNKETNNYWSADHLLESAVYVFCPKYEERFEAHIAAHRG